MKEHPYSCSIRLGYANKTLIWLCLVRATLAVVSIQVPILNFQAELKPTPTGLLLGHAFFIPTQISLSSTQKLGSPIHLQTWIPSLFFVFFLFFPSFPFIFLLFFFFPAHARGTHPPAGAGSRPPPFPHRDAPLPPPFPRQAGACPLRR